LLDSLLQEILHLDFLCAIEKIKSASKLFMHYLERRNKELSSEEEKRALYQPSKDRTRAQII